MTIQELLEKADIFGDSAKVWQYPYAATDNAPRGPRPGRELFLECVKAVREYLADGQGQRCFDASSALGMDRAARDGGPRGIYGAMHLSTAAWYESQGRKQDRDRLLRCATIDIGHL